MNVYLGELRDLWKRVYDAIAGPPGSAAPVYGMQVAGTDGTNLRAMKMDADGHPQVDVLTLPSVSAADGGLVSIGAKADTAVTDPTLSASEIALLKGLLKQLQGTGPTVTPVSLNGSFDTFRTPVVGIKTVTATAAEIFAGASRLSGRRKMVLKNEDPVLRFRIGPSSVTQQNGFPVEPGAVLELTFDPNVSVPVYAISEGASLMVVVMEL